MALTSATSLSATGSVTSGSFNAQVLNDTLSRIFLYGTYGTVTGVIEASNDNSNWFPVAATDYSTGQLVSGTLTLTDNTSYSWGVDVRNVQYVRFRVTAIASGSVTVVINSERYAEQSPVINVSVNSSAAQTFTSTSANALAVGPSGTTNPTLQVDASTASAATGLKVKSAAAAAGLALSVVSSGTNEALTIDAKGSGTITLAGTSTGNIVASANLAITDAKNVVLATTTGTKIGTATTQKLGFFNATPVVQPAANTDATTGAAGGTNTVYLNTTFTGASGTAAYTIGGAMTALKALGLLAP